MYAFIKQTDRTRNSAFYRVNSIVRRIVYFLICARATKKT